MDFLEALVNTAGVPGREEGVRALIEHRLRTKQLADEIQTDVLGSLIARRMPRTRDGKTPERSKRVLLAAHMDQIGFLVSHISREGFLYLHPVGAFDPRILFARRVTVYAETGEIFPGVVNGPGRPIHTVDAATLATTPKIDEFYVDLSMPPEAVKSAIRLGDMVVLDGKFAKVGNSVVGAGLDDRVGCWAIIRALETLQFHDCELICAWTVQEELGSRGAGPVSFGQSVDIGISCDTTVCAEVPEVAEEQRVTKAGAGVALQVADSSTLSDMTLVRTFERIAKDKSIPVQRSLMVGGGQDGAPIQRSRLGVSTIVLSCPVKYLHTTVEMVRMEDLQSYCDMLHAFLAEV